jgi:hypothetical protein
MARVSKDEGFVAQHVINGRVLRGKTHSSHGDRKAYLTLNSRIETAGGRAPVARP